MAEGVAELRVSAGEIARNKTNLIRCPFLRRSRAQATERPYRHRLRAQKRKDRRNKSRILVCGNWWAGCSF